jgi:hypothetical protein
VNSGGRGKTRRPSIPPDVETAMLMVDADHGTRGAAVSAAQVLRPVPDAPDSRDGAPAKIHDRRQSGSSKGRHTCARSASAPLGTSRTSGEAAAWLLAATGHAATAPSPTMLIRSTAPAHFITC